MILVSLREMAAAGKGNYKNGLEFSAFDLHICKEGDGCAEMQPAFFQRVASSFLGGGGRLFAILQRGDPPFS